MAYIGNAKTPLILTTNVRDDLVPGYNSGTTTGPFNKKQFLLSQEVPGGDEKNITVIRRKYIVDSLVDVDSDTPTITIQEVSNGDTYLTVSVSNPELSAALSVIQPESTNYEGDLVKLSFGAGSPIIKRAHSLEYDGTNITITLKTDEENSGLSFDGLINISRSFYAPWEILDAKTEYSIVDLSVENPNFNRVVELKEAPQEDDVVYVLHRGDATYNFVPSPSSVGLEQLSDSLKNFTCDRPIQSVAGNTTFSLSQKVANSKALLVTIDGVVQDDATEYAIDAAGTAITFTAAPAVGANIRILHLGVVSKDVRAAFSPGQETAVVDDGSITTAKLADNAVNGTKIRLKNNEPIKALYDADGTDSGILGIESNDTVLSSRQAVKLRTSSNKTLSFTNESVTTSDSGVTSLGTSTNKFKDLHISGDAAVGGNVTLAGNITLSTSQATVDGVDLSALKAEFDALKTKVSSLIPIGTIVLWSKAESNDSNWLVCDGSAVSRSSYSELFSVIGTAFGSGDGSTTFNIPDLRRRASVGKGTADSIGASDGAAEGSRSLSHTHTAPEHTHSLSDHTHTLDGHKHSITGSSTLAISSSGTHSTSLNHTHDSVYTGTPTHPTTNAAASLSHQHSIDHGHTGANTDAATADHFHTGTVNHSHTGTVNHSHTVKYNNVFVIQSVPGGTGGNIRNVIDGSNSSSSGSVNTTTDNPALTIASSNPSLSINNTSAGHSHSLNIGATSGLSSANNTQDLSHKHLIPSSQFSGDSTSPGTHTHGAASFSGSIGNDSANDGNSTLTTNAAGAGSTGTPSYTSSSATSSVITPHLVLNYVIKAKDI